MRQWLVAGLTVLALVGCGDDGPEDLVVSEVVVGADDRVLGVNAESCEPVDVSVEETEHEVGITASGKVIGPLDDCGAGLDIVQLDQPLGSRQLIGSDGPIGDVIRCTDDIAGGYVQACDNLAEAAIS